MWEDELQKLIESHVNLYPSFLHSNVSIWVLVCIDIGDLMYGLKYK